MNMHKAVVIGTVSLVCTAVTGCIRLTSLGISSEHIVGGESTAAEPPHATVLRSSLNKQLTPNVHVGDVDGDGRDDLLVGTLDPSSKEAPPPKIVYLFYGRSSFPQELRPEDADASFESGFMESHALGDINGDGFADFALADESGSEFVFGSAQRFHGHHAKFTVGPKWQYGMPASDEEPVTARFWRFYPVGDVNADGSDDVIVQLAEPVATERKWAMREYLVEGRKDSWPSGAWQASWAAASFTFDEITFERTSFSNSGDLDGDGAADLVVRHEIFGEPERYGLFYGRRSGLHGALTGDDADVRLEVGEGYPNISVDMDGDGATELQVYSSGELQVVYGSRTRWSGVYEPQADLTFAGQSGIALAGDLNADGHSDLIISASPAVEHPDAAVASPTTLYKIKGDGTRLVGRYDLKPEQRYQPVGYPLPEALKGRSLSMLELPSDYDGDGSSDLIFGTFDESIPDMPQLSFFLLPGNSRNPD